MHIDRSIADVIDGDSSSKLVYIYMYIVPLPNEACSHVVQCNANCNDAELKVDGACVFHHSTHRCSSPSGFHFKFIYKSEGELWLMNLKECREGKSKRGRALEWKQVLLSTTTTTSTTTTKKEGIAACIWFSQQQEGQLPWAGQAGRRAGDCACASNQIKSNERRKRPQRATHHTSKTEGTGTRPRAAPRLAPGM